MVQLGVFKTTTELHDLGQFSEEWSGILSPSYDEDLKRKYIHDQIFENASEYIAKYQNLDYWGNLLKSAQSYYVADPEKELKILDIGSGTGNTVFSLMELYPNATIVAICLFPFYSI
jgi:hypothetical protein